MEPNTRILIVEDEEALAENLKNFLARSSPHVRVALDARATHKILESFTPDVVVLDFGLPGIDGLQTYTVVVQRRAPKASCVIITGHPIENIIRAANDYGIRYVLCKPFSFAELQKMIDLSLGEAALDGILDATVSARYQKQGMVPPLALSEHGIVATNRRRIERRLVPDRRQLNAVSGQGG